MSLFRFGSQPTRDRQCFFPALPAFAQGSAAKALSEFTFCDVEKKPLQEVADWLAERHDIKVVITPKIKDRAKTRVTFTSKGDETLRKALGRLLPPLKLGYTVKGDTLTLIPLPES